MKRKLLLGAGLIACVLVTGCSIPQMELIHAESIDATYPTLGSIKVNEFEDERPDEEKVIGKTATNSLSAQVWSGDTDPGMMVFFQQVLTEEAQRTGLFTTDGAAAYELDGSVTSMKVTRKVTVMRYLALVPFLAGLLVSDSENTTPMWIGLAGWAALLSFEFPKLDATVQYHAILTKNGETVFETDIEVTHRRKYSVWTEWGWKGVSQKAQRALDEAITMAINQLFERIKSEVSADMSLASAVPPHG